jgi:hypothetical protein
VRGGQNTLCIGQDAKSSQCFFQCSLAKQGFVNVFRCLGLVHSLASALSMTCALLPTHESHFAPELLMLIL